MLLSYDESGNGPPLLLINGFALDRRCWDSCVPLLAERHQVVRCELRGCGDSPAPTGPYHHADDIAELIVELQLGPAAVVGLSMGGGVALDVARLHPDLISSLVLAGSDVPGVPLSRDMMKVILGVIDHATHGRERAARDVWMSSPFVGRTSPDVRAAIRAMVDDYGGFHWLHRDPHVADRTNAAHLPDLHARALVIRGEHETAHLAGKSELLVDALPNARSVVVPDAGHLVCMEQPAVFCRHVLDFLSTEHVDGYALP